MPDSLLGGVDRNPDIWVNAARSYCAARQSGKTNDQVMNEQYQEFSQMMQSRVEVNPTTQLSQDLETSMAAMSIAVQLAPEQYCPNVNQSAS
ncbi:MAG: hypothetical protein LH660_09620 [Phormidesmis sp. CAN_BIN36]|nr:hypothetical protein [Phormidesmis sp. CAN_BIN36]